MIEPREISGKIRTSIYMDVEMYKKLVKLKHQTDKSISAVVVEMIDYYYKQEEAHAK